MVNFIQELLHAKTGDKLKSRNHGTHGSSKETA